MDNTIEKHLTIELEGGGRQSLPLRKDTLNFFASKDVFSANSCKVNPNIWKLMSEEHRISMHLNRLVSTLGGKSFTINN